MLYPDADSLFLNYALDLNIPETLLDIPLEMGLRTGPFLLLTGARAASGGSAQHREEPDEPGRR